MSPRRALAPLSLLLAACAGDPAPTPDAAVLRDATADLPGNAPGPYPSASELPERSALPSLDESFDGTRRVSSRADWESWRRAELRDLFAHYIYGHAPPPVVVRARTITSVDALLPTVARYTEAELTLGDGPARLHLALFLPVGVSRPRVFLALNKCGNQEALPDPRVRASDAWIEAGVCGDSPEAARGVRASHWPIADITARGYAFATLHESEIDPDRADDLTFSDGVHPHFVPAGRDPRVRWGRIAAWAWGLSRAVDHLRDSGLVDPDGIAVVGHSRRGKAALLAGALDDRIAMVLAHQSGTAGAALSRSAVGESLLSINTFFPSWFNDVFPTFNGREPRLPVDQHQLIALVAPRRVLCTDGDDDTWADPPGARAAVEAALPAWARYGVSSDEGRAQWQTRPGGHSLTAADWELFLAFADRAWRPAAP